MKLSTITTLLAALMAIPVMLGRRKPEVKPIPVEAEPSSNELESNIRYDLYDLFSR